MNPNILDPDREPSPEEVQLAVLERIHTAIENELVELDHAVKKRPLNAVAWISRNLIDLCIWTERCIDSPQNARGFFNDAALDSLDILRAPNGVFTEDPTFSLQRERERIIEQAKVKGVEGLDGLPSRVDKAAHTVGKGAEFKWTNKLLSKLAHATALWVMTPNEGFEKLRFKIYQGGLDNGNDALVRIESSRQIGTDAKTPILD